ncbi:hypothetical protein ANCCAN_13670 [Ancylostoma caninum]|uniref:Uncharacterized protein n=1 Tax=Ancylostoma caninum TaxID=29170 RepID=A0A368GAS6_ANCCA|nr:hypothetical protein ANCCAN_13670 [Ancylostoma caninum]
MMQARKIRYEYIGLTESRRYRPLNTTSDTGEELFLRKVGKFGPMPSSTIMGAYAPVPIYDEAEI